VRKGIGSSGIEIDVFGCEGWRDDLSDGVVGIVEYLASTLDRLRVLVVNGDMPEDLDNLELEVLIGNVWGVVREEEQGVEGYLVFKGMGEAGVLAFKGIMVAEAERGVCE
jgi:hypothetical protein